MLYFVKQLHLKSISFGWYVNACNVRKIKKLSIVVILKEGCYWNHSTRMYQ